MLDTSNAFQSEHLAANLLALLKATPQFTPRGLLDPRSMSEALVQRFGQRFLKDAGLERWYHAPPIGIRPGRTLSRDVIEGRRIPSVLRTLLLSRLVAEEAVQLASKVPVVTSESHQFPQGYTQRRTFRQAALTADAIRSAIDDAQGRLCSAATQLGMSCYSLAADMQHYRIRHPLQSSVIKRLGEKTIVRVRKALAQGTPKKKVMESLCISEWSMTLIELDMPELLDAHREAYVSQQRSKHRNALLKFRQCSPSAPRSQFLEKHAGAYDWLRTFDHQWLTENLPPIKVPQAIRPSNPRKDWAKIDQAAVARIRQTAIEELEKTERPSHLTRTRLLSSANALAAMDKRNANRFENALLEAELHSENKDAFLRRVIRWALEKYKELHIPISMNKLRRVSRLNPQYLYKNRDYVIEVAKELGLPFNARTALSPWRHS